MKKILTVSTALFLLCYTETFAQQWVVSQNGTGNQDDVITAMSVDNIGNVYITGYSYTKNRGNDYLTIKYNTDGKVQWKKLYNGPGNGDDNARAIFVDDGGNVCVTGTSDAHPGFAIDNDVATIKYDPQGLQLWAVRYDGNIVRADAGNAIKADASGNVYVTGFVTLPATGYSATDFLTLKYNSNGVLQWAATHNGPGNEDDVAVGLGLERIHGALKQFALRTPLQYKMEPGLKQLC